MLNPVTGMRELCSIVKVDDIKPIPGKDRVECAVVKGWTMMVPKGEFHVGSLGVYFEIDSKLPEVEPFMFLAQRKFKVKTQKYKNSDGSVFYSQGLLMSAGDFGGEELMNIDNIPYLSINGKCYMEGDFATEDFGVTYYEPEDNKRKANIDKYASMKDRHKNLFKKQPFKFLMRYEWGRKILFKFFGKKKEVWPAFMPKTDEERIQWVPHLAGRDEEWTVTEKIDGSSASYAIAREPNLFRKNKFYTCSRNVVYITGKENCYYDTNFYTEIGQKYCMENVLNKMLEDYPEEKWIYIQGEIYGKGVQKRTYGLKGRDFAAFNLAFSTRGRIGSKEAKEILEKYGVPFVPIVKTVHGPFTIEEVLEDATATSTFDDDLQEGYVYRSLDGALSFKAISNEFLMKFKG